MKLSTIQRQQLEDAFKQFEENQNQQTFLAAVEKATVSCRTRRNRIKSSVSLNLPVRIPTTLRTNPYEVIRTCWLRVLGLSRLSSKRSND
jgi:hypothetical protein